MLLTHYKSNQKYKKNNNAQGITLIELLVVITIMMTMMTLVAPLAINTVNKAEAQSEFLSFCATLRRASVKAFANGSKIQISLNNNQLIAYKVNSDNYLPSSLAQPYDKVIFEVEYEYLTFEEEYINFNKNGIANVQTINLKQRNLTKLLDLIKLLEG
jgi:type II secretory pathway pseudopilin PulG